jgi:hypothetical protein
MSEWTSIDEAVNMVVKQTNVSEQLAMKLLNAEAGGGKLEARRSVSSGDLWWVKSADLARFLSRLGGAHVTPDLGGRRPKYDYEGMLIEAARICFTENSRNLTRDALVKRLADWCAEHYPSGGPTLGRLRSA